MRVLLVDDDPLFLESAARLLAAEAGFTVVGRARSGRQAMDMAASLRPDLVLMDVEMPGMDGLETTRRLKARASAPRVLLVSIYDSEARRRAAAAAGADGYVGKWEFPWRLTAAIWATAEGRRAAGSGTPEAAGASAAGPATSIVPEVDPRVLIVDDHPVVSSLMADMLVDAGYLVETVSDARMALRRLESEPFDVILSDVRMPEMDGPAFFGELVRRRPELAGRVILITGDLLTDDLAVFFARTRVPSLGKPFTLDELQDAVRRVLAGLPAAGGSTGLPHSAACGEER